MNKVLALLLLVLAGSFCLAQTISNVREAQDPELGYYKITFDLSGRGNDLYYISVKPYQGGTQLNSPQYVQGMGIQGLCPPGKDNQVFWNPVLAGVEPTGWKFELTAQASEWILVQGGKFNMGSNEGGEDEKPVHQVTVSPFYLSKYELTVAEFRAFISATGYKTNAERGGGAYVWSIEESKWMQKADANWTNPYYTQSDRHPVSCVSWYDAVAYCNWHSRKEGLSPVYSLGGNTDPADWSKGEVSCDWSANGYRLPTEAEWEFAARGGVKSKGYTYSGSNDINAVAWYGNARDSAHATGTKAANEIGIYDMSGNVWEWCWDWYASDYYKSSPGSDPRGAGSGSYRVLRGGSWDNVAVSCRVANRYNDFPDNRNYNGGLRLARAK